MHIGARFWGLLLVVAGLLFLFGQMHLLASWGLSITFGTLWPLLLVLLGLGGLGKLGRGKIPWMGIFLVVYGALLVLRNTHAVPALQSVGGFALFWCLVLLVGGLALLLPKRTRWPKVHVGMHGHDHSIDLETAAKTWKDWKKNRRSSWRWIGDISLGRQPWALKDTDLWNAIGDIRVNLGTAHVEEGTYHLSIGGWIGDVRVLVPDHLPVMVNASVSLGDLAVFDDIQSGTGRTTRYVHPEFDAAATRVVIDVDLKIGDVQIVRV